MKQTNRIDRLVANLAYGAMAEMLSLPKKIDELKKLPAYVKDGEVFDFNDRSFGETSKPDGEIFDVARVLKTQAVTQALKTAYTKALTEWMEVSEDEAKETESTTKVKEEKAVAKTKPKKVKSDEAVPSESEHTTDGEIDLLKSVVKLLKKDDVKGAKKLVKANKDHPKYKKAKKLVKGAE